VRNILTFTLIAVALMLVSGCNKEFGITGVSPEVGMLSGGEPIEINGSGFDTHMGVSVYFGTIKAPKVVVNNEKKMTVSTPSSSETKTVDIRIALDDGREFLIPDAFRFVEKGAMDIRDLGKRKSRRQRPNE
jgi:hypothetical protein